MTWSAHCLQLDNLDLQFGTLGRELLKKLVLLTQLNGELVSFHVQSRCLQLGLDKVVLDSAVLETQLLKLLI